MKTLSNNSKWFIISFVLLISVILLLSPDLLNTNSDDQREVQVVGKGIKMKDKASKEKEEYSVNDSNLSLRELARQLALESLGDLSKFKYTKEEKNKIPSSVKEEMLDLPAEEQAVLKYEVDYINEKIREEGGTWTADYNSISIKDEREKKKLLGLKLTEKEIAKPQQNLKEKKLKSPSNITLGAAGGGGNGIPGEPVFPAQFDWRDRHGMDYITPVKSQGSCGSCWAFAAVAALEGSINAYFNNPDLDVDLSEQDLVSCCSAGDCGGGYCKPVFTSYFMNPGITLESCFPYTATNNNCGNKCSGWEDIVWKTTSYVNVELNPYFNIQANVDAIKQALIEYGPVKVSMFVYSDFYSYSGGIYEYTTGSFEGGHAVTIVGFGTYNDSDYWIVKNSWGEDWGEDGYFRIYTHECGIDRLEVLAVVQPMTYGPTERLCYDADGDGYCNWGLGEKPSYGCPTCNDTVMDCDDSNASIFEGCFETYENGILYITSTPNNSEIYVKDMENVTIQEMGEEVEYYGYHGLTPLEIGLHPGLREIKVSKFEYLDNYSIVNITGGERTELDITLTFKYPIPIQEGWPQEVDSSTDCRLVIADLDGDNESEILGCDEERVYAWHHDGTLMEGWPVYTGPRPYTPSVGDLDGDGKMEVVVGLSSGFNLSEILFVFRFDGSPYPGDWPKDTGDINSITDAVVLADLDNNGLPEIIGGGGDSKLYAWHHDGTLMEGWPVTGGSYNLIYHAVGDIDGDGQPEVVAAENNKRVYAWEADGSSVWSRSLSYSPSFPPALGDVDGDGQPEVVILAGFYLYVLEGDGSVMPGWPKPLNSSSCGLSLGDLDGDNVPEIVFVNSYKVWALKGDSSFLGGWPYKFESDIEGCNPLTGNIDSDAEQEVVVPAEKNDESEEILIVLENDGSLASGYPVYMDISKFPYPALGDLDGDGDVELAAKGTNYYFDRYYIVYDLGGIFDGRKLYWPMFMHDAQHTGLYSGPPPTEFCSDTDGGLDYYVKGNVNSLNLTYVDYCSGLTLTEYYCINTSVQSVNYNCPQQCINGACTQTPPTEYCTDTDGGIDYYVKGYINSTNGTYTDQCLTNTTTLTEYYCYNQTPQTTNYNCPQQCINGACITSPTDVDGDGIIDIEDNCLLEPNPWQNDSDSDGYGNACDCDFNNNNICGLGDLWVLLACFLNPDLTPESPYCKNRGVDMSGDGIFCAHINCSTGHDDWILFDQLFPQPALWNETPYPRTVPGPSGLPDTDGDTIFDRFDNCLNLSNTNQCDTNKDGYGNLCDTDLDNDGDVDNNDSMRFSELWQNESDPNYLDADINCDGVVGIGYDGKPDDYFKYFWPPSPNALGETPGPSGYECAGTTPCPP